MMDGQECNPVCNNDTDNKKMEQQTWLEWAKRNWIKLVLVAALVLLIVYVIIDSVGPTKNIKSVLDNFLDWVKENPTQGFFAFVFVYMVATIMFIPGSILTLGAGLTFVSALGTGKGIGVGVAAVVVGAFIGSQLAFLGGRFIFKDFVAGLASKFPVIAAIDSVFEKEGLKLNLLLRFSPVVPFSAFNYLMGGTSSRYIDYAIGTLGIIPGSTLYVYVGAIPVIVASGTAEGGDSNKNAVTIALLVVGGVFTVVAVVIVTIYAKKALAEKIKEGEDTKTAKEALEDGVQNPQQEVEAGDIPCNNKQPMATQQSVAMTETEF